MAYTARTFNLPSLHKRALYECCQLPPEQLLQGTRGSPLDENGHLVFSYGSLTFEELTAVVAARQTLPRVEGQLFIDTLSHLPIVESEPDHQCKQFKETRPTVRFEEARQRQALLFGYHRDVARPYQEGLQRGEHMRTLCGGVDEAVRQEL